MNYDSALAYIDSEDKRGHRGGLSSISALLSYLGNPQDELKFIHVTGTNGKGSTCAFLASILQSAGYRVGLFTSPHILSFNERFQVNRTNISDEDVARYMTLVKTKIDDMVSGGLVMPSYFEITVAIGMLYFKDMGVDYVVAEVGIGGENDPTNIIKNTVLSVISPIAFDHTDRLGSTIEEIAIEKSGIIKPDSKVISYSNNKTVNDIMKDKAMEVGSEIQFLDSSDISGIVSGEDYNSFYYKNSRYEIKLMGWYQVYNCALAIAGMKMLLPEIDESKIKDGVKSTVWIARMTRIMKYPRFYIDGAHNEHGIDALVTNIKKLNYDKLILGIGIMKDKSADSSLSRLTDLADMVISTSINYERALDKGELANRISHKEILEASDIDDAVRLAIENAKPNDLIVFTGSLYMVGEVYKAVEEMGLISE